MSWWWCLCVFFQHVSPQCLPFNLKAGTHPPNCWTSEAFGENWTMLGTDLFGVFNCVGSFRSRADVVCSNSTCKVWGGGLSAVSDWLCASCMTILIGSVLVNQHGVWRNTVRFVFLCTLLHHFLFSWSATRLDVQLPYPTTLRPLWCLTCSRCNKRVALVYKKDTGLEVYARNSLYFRSKRNLTISDKNSCILNMQWGITKRTQINLSWTDIITESNGSDVRQPTSSDFACWIEADNVREAPKASNAAEHTEHICSRPRPSLSKRFRCPTVGPVCSCLKCLSPSAIVLL